MKVHALLLLIAFYGLFEEIESHSYVECADWRFNDPSKGGWAENEGTCHGYARKWPRGKYPNVKFGHFDDIWGGYKDQGRLVYGSQRYDPDTMPACHPDTQTRTNPITNSYAPYNSNYGVMVQTSPGKQLCFTWSGRNHADGGERCVERNLGVVCPVYINWAPNPDEDPSQAVLSANNVAIVTFQNCTRNNPNYNNADRPCGGCFTVPQRSPGIYTVQFRWALNANAGGTKWPETYTTCIDVNVTSASPAPSTSSSTSGSSTSSSTSSRSSTSTSSTTSGSTSTSSRSSGSTSSTSTSSRSTSTSSTTSGSTSTSSRSSGSTSSTSTSSRSSGSTSTSTSSRSSGSASSTSTSSRSTSTSTSSRPTTSSTSSRSTSTSTSSRSTSSTSSGSPTSSTSSSSRSSSSSSSSSLPLNSDDTESRDDDSTSSSSSSSPSTSTSTSSSANSDDANNGKCPSADDCVAACTGQLVAACGCPDGKPDIRCSPLASLEEVSAASSLRPFSFLF